MLEIKTLFVMPGWFLCHVIIGIVTCVAWNASELWGQEWPGLPGQCSRFKVAAELGHLIVHKLYPFPWFVCVVWLFALASSCCGSVLALSLRLGPAGFISQYRLGVLSHVDLLERT